MFHKKNRNLISLQFLFLFSCFIILHIIQACQVLRPLAASGEGTPSFFQNEQRRQQGSHFPSKQAYAGQQPLHGPGFVPPQIFRPINHSTWRARIPANQLFALIMRHLSASYIVRGNEGGSMSLQTEWDKFFIGGRLFRNRLSVSLFALSPLDTELVINNKVEYFQQPEEHNTYGESDWIPTQDITNEKSQLIEGITKIIHAINLSSASGTGARPY